MATLCDLWRPVSRLGLEPRTYGLTCRQGSDATALPATASGDKLGSVARQLPTVADPDLARVILAWPDLPDHIRAAILALVGTAG
jgi:hypothetical protein